MDQDEAWRFDDNGVSVWDGSVPTVFVTEQGDQLLWVNGPYSPPPVGSRIDLDGPHYETGRRGYEVLRVTFEAVHDGAPPATTVWLKLVHATSRRW